MINNYTNFENSLIVRLLPKDTNPQGYIFGGVIMSWMDQAAGVAAQRHCGQRVVTASADEMIFLSPISVGDVLILKTKLVYTGKTSMDIEVAVEIENIFENIKLIGATAFFTMVAVDENNKPIPVKPMTLDLPEDKVRYEAAVERRRHKGLI